MTDERATRAMQEVGRIHVLPILTKLGNHWAATAPSRPTIAVNLHLTTFCRARSGAAHGWWSVARKRRKPQHHRRTVALLREEEVEVFTGGDMTNPTRRPKRLPTFLSTSALSSGSAP